MFFDRKVEERDISINDWKEVYSIANGYEDGIGDNQMKESTYFNCIKIISDSVAKCSLQIKKEGAMGETVDRTHNLNDILTLRHNDYMGATDSMKTFIALAKHNGRAGLYINRDKKGKVIGLYPVKITGCTVDNKGLIKGVTNNKILWDCMSVENEQFPCFDKDLIVLKDFTLDGIKTKAIKSIARESLDSSIKAQGHLNNLFTNGMTNKLVVQNTGDIKEEKKLKELQGKFDRLYSSTGKIFTVPVGYNVQSLSMSLSEGQFVELRRLSKEEIASCFQVPLSKLGIRNETAISEEADNIKFLSDCLEIIFKQLEQEMDWKLLTLAERKMGYKIRFNIASMLRLDATTQANVICKYVQQGVYSLNQAKEILGIEKLAEDVTTFPSGQVTLETLMNGNASYQNKSNSIENVGDVN